MDKNISRKEFLAGVTGLAVVALVDGCGGTPGSNATASGPRIAAGQEGLTASQAALFDAAPHLPPFDLAAVTLADGTTVAGVLHALQTPQVRPHVPDARSLAKKESPNPTGAALKTPAAYKRDCLAQMLAAGNALTDRTSHQYPSNGPDAPAQDGLGYVFGDKNPAMRTKSSGGDERLYGLDASGLVAVCAAAGGISLRTSVTAAELIDPAVWNAALPNVWNLRMMAVTDGTFQNGDIVGNGSHVGIVSQDAHTGTAIIQSHGVREDLTPSAPDFTQDRLNGGPKRGPNIIPLTALDAYFKTGDLRTIRLVPASSFVVELNWGAQPDLDLHVFEPDGTHVYYPNKIGNSGFLDRDCVTGFGPEHYTTYPDLLDGNYRVGVNYYFGSAPETAVIIISAGTQTAHYEIPLQTADENAGDASPVMAATIDVITNGSGQKTFIISAA